MLQNKVLACPSRRSPRNRKSSLESNFGTISNTRHPNKALSKLLNLCNDEDDSEANHENDVISEEESPIIMTRSLKRRVEAGEVVLRPNLIKSRKGDETNIPGQVTRGNQKKKFEVGRVPDPVFLNTSSSDTIDYKTWEDTTLKCFCRGEDCPVSKETSSGHPTANVRPKCKGLRCWNYDRDWVEPEFVQYREISGWPHLNECIETLEVLNIGGTNVLGEFIPFVLLSAPNLKSLGQWINTMNYGIEILRKIAGHQDASFPNLQEFSYSTDRNYFCQPYIGFVPESPAFKSVRKEMVRYSAKVRQIK